jgi:hypothetical protein
MNTIFEERILFFEEIEQRIKDLEKKFNKTRSQAKERIYGEEIIQLKRIKNFSFWLYQGRFNREFLHLMFDGFDPFLDGYRFQKDLINWIKLNKHKYQRKDGKSEFALAVNKVLGDKIKVIEE